MSKAKKIKRTATVDTFLLILSGELTQYDRRQSKSKYYNRWAMGHYFDAWYRVAESVDAVSGSDSPLALQALLEALAANFLKRDNDPEKFVLPPINKIVKKINAWLTDGKYPSYPISKVSNPK